MWQVMRDNKGIGLAAPQVGEALSIAVIDVGTEPPLVMFNPTVISRDGRRVCTEGCLSLPGESHRVYRAKTIEVQYTDLNGDTFRVRARKNLLAQALEHECDHLRGVLIDGR
jgi:peptide deformylase